MANENNIGGIIEISAVATLIGAPVAEALTVGLKSAVGLPWASISSFGLLHVAKAALAAAIPDWLREPLGLSNNNVQLALGQQQVLLENKVASRTELGDPQAIAVRRSKKPTKSARCQCNAKHIFGCTVCIYGSDRYSALVLATVPDSDLGKEVLIHQFTYDPGYDNRWLKGWIILFLSTIKIGEVIALRLMGANLLWLFSALPWAWSLVASIILTITRKDGRDDEHIVDVATGHLPSALSAGGRAKIVLGIPANPRRNRLWTLTWYVCSAVVLCGLIGTYVVLGKNKSQVVYTWLGLQAGFLALRTLVYYLLENVYGQRHGLARAWSWHQCEPELRRRALDLLIAIAVYEETTHPRGARTYTTDLACLARLNARLLEVSYQVHQQWIAPEGAPMPLTIDLLDVVGDNLLRAANWLHGATLTNNDLYDSALAFIVINGQKLAVPAVRVMACKCRRAENELYPRGDSHGVTCVNICWYLWIPVRCTHAQRHDSTASTLALLSPTLSGSNTPNGSSRSNSDENSITSLGEKGTALVRSNSDMGIGGFTDTGETGWLVLGTQRMSAESLACEYLSDRDLNRKLAKKEWRISLTDAAEFHEILKVSRQASRMLVDMVSSAAVSTGGRKDV